MGMKAQRQEEGREPGWGVEGWERTERKSEAGKDRRNLGVGGEGEGGWGAGEAGSGGGGGGGVGCPVCAGGVRWGRCTCSRSACRLSSSRRRACMSSRRRCCSFSCSFRCSRSRRCCCGGRVVWPYKGCTRHGDSTAPEGGPTPAHFWKADPYWTVRAGLHLTGDGGERGWLQLVSTNLSTLT